MFCKYCGKEVADDSLFCPYCGKSLQPMTEGTKTGQEDRRTDSGASAPEAQNINGQDPRQQSGNAQGGNAYYGGSSGYNGSYGGYAPYGQRPPYYGPPPEPVPSAGWGVLCFFFPVVGLILFLVWHDTYPLRAKMCGKGALISVIVYAAAVVLMLVIVFIAAAIAADTAAAASAGASAALL